MVGHHVGITSSFKYFLLSRLAFVGRYHLPGDVGYPWLFLVNMAVESAQYGLQRTSIHTNSEHTYTKHTLLIVGNFISLSLRI